MGNPKKTKNMKFAIVLVVAALVAAAAANPAPGLCGRCVEFQSGLNIKTEDINACAIRLSTACVNETACLDGARKMCTDAAAGVDATQTCSDPKLGACGTVAVTSPVPQIWGECGGCQDLVHAGIDASEHFLCEGALDEGCDMLLDYVCDAGCMATWTCHEFHACKSGPSSSCCKKCARLMPLSEAS